VERKDAQTCGIRIRIMPFGSLSVTQKPKTGGGRGGTTQPQQPKKKKKKAKARTSLGNQKNTAGSLAKFRTYWKECLRPKQIETVKSNEDAFPAAKLQKKQGGRAYGGRRGWS